LAIGFLLWRRKRLRAQHAGEAGAPFVDQPPGSSTMSPAGFSTMTPSTLVATPHAAHGQAYHELMPEKVYHQLDAQPYHHELSARENHFEMPVGETHTRVPAVEAGVELPGDYPHRGPRWPA